MVGGELKPKYLTSFERGLIVAVLHGREDFVTLIVGFIRFFGVHRETLRSRG